MDEKLNDEIKDLRDVLFPAIGLQIITGFNSYSSKENHQANDEDNIIIRYLHEDILEDRLHYVQIKRMLEKYCDKIKIRKIKH